MSRRSFIHLSDLGAMPVIAGQLLRLTAEKATDTPLPTLTFVRDGPAFTPEEYVNLSESILMFIRSKRKAVSLSTTKTIAVTRRPLRIGSGSVDWSCWWLDYMD